MTMAAGQGTAAVVQGVQDVVANLAGVATKPGYTKTEFWGTALLSIAGAALTYAQTTPYGILASAAASGIYTIARSVVTYKADQGKWSAITSFLNSLQQAPASNVPPAPPGRM